MATSGTELDTREFERALLQAAGRLERNSRAEELRIAHEAADTMRQTVRKRSGRTAASIRVEDQGPLGAVVVTGGASLALEYGTQHQPPHSFARPALARAGAGFRRPSW